MKNKHISLCEETDRSNDWKWTVIFKRSILPPEDFKFLERPLDRPPLVFWIVYYEKNDRWPILNDYMIVYIERGSTERWRPGPWLSRLDKQTYGMSIAGLRAGTSNLGRRGRQRPGEAWYRKKTSLWSTFVQIDIEWPFRLARERPLSRGRL